MLGSTGTRRSQESRSSCSWGSRTSLDGATSTGSSGTGGRMPRSRSSSLACFRWSASNGGSNTEPSEVCTRRARDVVGRLAGRRRQFSGPRGCRLDRQGCAMAVTGSAPIRVLLIDDDQDLNALLARYLRGFNFEVRVTANPHEGLLALERDAPDIVILDVMLPDMDGFAVCRQVRERSRVPIVMLTARGDVGDRIVGLELGADDYVSKPFAPRELMARMQAVLRRSVG